MIKTFLLFLWQLPQYLVGFVVYLFFKMKNKTLERTCTLNSKFWIWSLGSGLSLTEHFMFVGKYANINTYKHEFGHSIQSKLLGWLYLPIIGIPSILWASLKTLGLFKNKSYYSFYTEKWADKLGRVTRL